MCFRMWTRLHEQLVPYVDCPRMSIHAEVIPIVNRSSSDIFMGEMTANESSTNTESTLGVVFFSACMYMFSITASV